MRRSSSENHLPRIAEEESLNVEICSNLGDGPSQDIPNRRFHQQFSTSSIRLAASDQSHQEREIARENNALKERCRVYESMIASLWSDEISYKLKKADALENLENTADVLKRGKKELMEECNKLEEQIIVLRFR
jgi:hypothetical protein